LGDPRIGMAPLLFHKMRKIRDVLRLSAAGMSKRKIAASLGMPPPPGQKIHQCSDLSLRPRAALRPAINASVANRKKVFAESSQINSVSLAEAEDVCAIDKTGGKSMKRLYALIFVCLSSPTLADVLDITPIDVNEDNTAAASAPAPQPIKYAVDFYVDEYDVDPVPTPIMKSTGIAEVQVAARDDDTMINEDAHTADVASSAMPKIEDRHPALVFSVEDEAPDFELQNIIGESELTDCE
jgi:hypothetical protein